MAAALSERELLALADALADGAWHSGEDLARSSGISRAALAKRVDKLRDIALDVEARQGLGYRLAAPLERLDLAVLRAAAPLRVDVVALTDSTNAQLLAADAGADPQALFAEFQSAGRGRRGRRWVSPFAANLYGSLAWSFAAWPPQLTTLSLAVGVACVRALRAAGVGELQLKWPNDLVAGGRKLGGILIEHRGEAGAGCRVVIGIGINVAMSAAQGAAVDQAWTSASAQSAAPVSRNRLAALLLRELDASLRAFATQGFAPFAPDWAALDLTRDREITVQQPDGALTGIARGVDEQGALLVDTPTGRERLHAGEVSVRVA
jgi:BirA family biotin operon repressor/biotin-[acetyl-CoA-carboxylase] ligase